MFEMKFSADDDVGVACSRHRWTLNNHFIFQFKGKIKVVREALIVKPAVGTFIT